MHELSIAMSIVEMAQEESDRRGGVQVHAVHLKVGQLSGVVREALCSCFEMACENTQLQGSQLVIEEVPVVVYCPSCQTRRTLDSMQLFCCPHCNTPTPDVVQGKELELVALEI